MTKRSRYGLAPILLATSGMVFVTSLVMGNPLRPQPIFLDQGKSWTTAQRTAFYSKNQGSELIPLSWVKALESPGNTGFLADGLARYGYILNPASPDGLPVGFTTDIDASGTTQMGLTCAACHTRELDVQGQRYRVDGGPAITDFQQFLTDLCEAVSTTLASPANFQRFGSHVLGDGASPSERAALRSAVQEWDQTEGEFFRRVLPASPWGVGRLDAVSMIFDRISALDIGNTAADAAHSEYPADAPVRYPFIWDAPKQNKTQWPGFAANGDNLLALNRNLGEVYGVFAHLRVRRTAIGGSFVGDNSANIENLIQLEQLVNDIGPPRWPWAIDESKRARGAAIFIAQCSSCHGLTIVTGGLIPRRETWATPVLDVGTDSREYDVLGRSAATGVLKGQILPPLGDSTKQFMLLKTVVIRSLLDYFHNHPQAFASLFPKDRAKTYTMAASFNAKAELHTAYDTDKARVTDSPAPGKFKYEARVLRGIWAAAPYLHNGSVQSLSQLLLPDRDRVSRFAIGPEFDSDAIGISAHQSGPLRMRVTTDCSARASGESHCGHNYGTTLKPDEKSDLLEYLKTL